MFKFAMGFLYVTPHGIIANMNQLARFLTASIFLLALDVRPVVAVFSESQIKSAYVLNFIKFAEWPAGANDELTLCVVGSNVLDGELSMLDGRKVGDRKLHVVQYAGTESNLNSCKAVFIGESEHRHFVSIIKALGDSSTLTVSDIEDFAENGGCIGLRYLDNRIVFEVNLATLRKSGLHLPGQLLNLAYYVFGR